VNQLFEQHLERTRTHPNATGASDITVETSNIRSHSNITLEASGIGRNTISNNIGSSDIRSSSIEASRIEASGVGARARPAVGFFGCGFSGGSVIEHVFDTKDRV